MEKGFASILLIGLFAVIVAIAGGTFFIFNNKARIAQNATTSRSPQNRNENSSSASAIPSSLTLPKIATKSNESIVKTAKATPMPTDMRPTVKNADSEEKSFAENVKYIIEISEGLDANTNKKGIIFHTKTKQQYSNLCYALDIKTSMRGSIIRVDYGKVIEPKPGTMCPQAIGSADSGEVFNLSFGTYQLNLVDMGKTDSYQINYSSESIEILPITVNFTYSLTNKLIKYDKTILGVSCRFDGLWTMNPQDGNCLKFFAEIQNVATLIKSPEQGKTPENLFFNYNGSMDAIVNIARKYSYSEYTIRGGMGSESFNCDSKNGCKQTTFETQTSYVDNKIAEELYAIKYVAPIETNIANCYQDDLFCVAQVAFTQKDETYCAYLPEMHQQQCYGYAAVGKRDPELCRMTNTCLTCNQECIESIAILNKDPKICDKASAYSRSREDCLNTYELKK